MQLEKKEWSTPKVDELVFTNTEDGGVPMSYELEGICHTDS